MSDSGESSLPPPEARINTELTFVPVSCPQCGYQGRVDLRRMSHVFKCKKCATNFIVDAGGVYREKDRPPPTPKVGAVVPDRPDFISKQIRRVEKFWSKIPQSAKRKTLLSIVGIAGLTGLLMYLNYTPAEEIPNAIQPRSQAVADAIMTRNAAAILRLSTATTSKSTVAEWLQKATPEFTGEAVTRLQIKGSESKSQSLACILTVAAGPGSDKKNQSKSVMLHWSREGKDGEWRLDVKRCLTAQAIGD